MMAQPMQTNSIIYRNRPLKVSLGPGKLRSLTGPLDRKKSFGGIAGAYDTAGPAVAYPLLDGPVPIVRFNCGMIK